MMLAESLLLPQQVEQTFISDVCADNLDCEEKCKTLYASHNYLNYWTGDFSIGYVWYDCEYDRVVITMI